MRIGIEAQRLFRPHKHGMDRVALELIRNLQEIDKENQYFIFVKPDEDREVISSTENFKIVEIPGGPYPYWEQLKLPLMARKYRCDLLHCTSNTAPLALQMPLVTTLHDVIFKESGLLEQLKSSASWYQKLGNIYRSVLVNQVVKKSQRLITVSNFEKENITKLFQLKGNRLKAIHNGVTEDFNNESSKDRLTEIRQHYSLPEHYILHIGNTDPRKNTRGVLVAYHQYLKKTDNAPKLVMVGLNRSKLNSLLVELGLLRELESEIVLTGYVPDKDLPAIFCGARLFLFPSLREGFGIPILEAMASGVPVVSSNTSSMPEVAGDAACLVSPQSTAEITNAIEKILSNENYRNELVVRGLQRSRSFSWRETANSVLEVYRDLNNKQQITN